MVIWPWICGGRQVIPQASVLLDKQREARRARGQYGSSNPPHSKVVECVCARALCLFAIGCVWTWVFAWFSLWSTKYDACLSTRIRVKWKTTFPSHFLSMAGLRTCRCVYSHVCGFHVCVWLAEVREMSCSVCVWLTLWSPPLIAGSMGCRQMPIFIGSWIKPLRYHL